jgi:hypothetical protein
LTNGASYAQFVRAVVAEGAHAVSLHSVRNHAGRHFPVQRAAQATYREIVERRAAENEIDFEKGLKIALTPMGHAGIISWVHCCPSPPGGHLEPASRSCGTL